MIGDLNPPNISHPALTYHQTDVTSWTDLCDLFKEAKRTHSTIDHVFANAGIAGRADYLAQTLDEAGNPLEPTTLTYDVNLRAAINTSTLAIHHMRHQPSPSGNNSIVITASASSFQPMCSPDYTASKHGVLGFVRGMRSSFQLAGIPIRINAITPSWTETALFPRELIIAAGGVMQTAAEVAPSAALLMADQARTGQVIYSEAGRMWEIEEAVLLPAALAVRVPGSQTLDQTLVKAMGLVEAAAAAGQAAGEEGKV